MYIRKRMIINSTESVKSTCSDFKDQCHINDPASQAIQIEVTASSTFKTHCQWQKYLSLKIRSVNRDSSAGPFKFLLESPN